jgi:pyridoxine 5-phosphate synthase
LPDSPFTDVRRAATVQRVVRLAVNIDHVATVREARKAREPEPIAAAVLAEVGGAEGITIHLRGDRRHIRDRDLELLRQVVRTKLNVEMAVADEMGEIARRTKPDQVTLVPERPDEVTTEGGLRVAGQVAAVRAMVDRLKGAGIQVSIFVDADVAQVRASKEAGADAIEINTGPYSEASGQNQTARWLEVCESARVAAEEGLEVLAGHGLTYFNVRPIVAVPEIVELNIGHSIVSRAVLTGMERAVRQMVALLR